MKHLFIIILIACTTQLYGQSLKEKIPGEYGITHHSIHENKIQLMKNANFALEDIKKFKRNRNLGAGLIIAGGGLAYYAGSFMDIPVKYPGYDEGEYDDKNRRRQIVGIAGGVMIGAGAYVTLRSQKLLKHAEI